MISITYPDPLPSQIGRRAVVTGAASGLGFETVRALALAGAQVVLAVRSAERGRAAAAIIRSEMPAALIEVAELDLADFASVRRFAERMAADGAALDMLVHNAGIMATPVALDADGIERQMATNHLGPVLLTSLLWPSLQRSASARVVTVTSDEYEKVKVERLDADTLRAPGSLSPFAWYGLTKFASMAFALALDERLRRAQSTIRSVAAHPGLANTGLPTQADGVFTRLMLRIGMATAGQSPRGGSRSLVHAAVGTDVQGGELWGPGGFGGLRGRPVRKPIAANASNADLRQQVWQASLTLTGAALPLS